MEMMTFSHWTPPVDEKGQPREVYDQDDVVVEQGLSLVAITQWSTKQFMRMKRLNLSFTPAIIREDIIALGPFHRSVVLARLRHRRRGSYWPLVLSIEWNRVHP
jgi:hypothetical protein